MAVIKSPSTWVLMGLVLLVFLSILQQHVEAVVCDTDNDCGSHKKKCLVKKRLLAKRLEDHGSCQCATFYGLIGEDCDELQIPVSERWMSKIIQPSYYSSTYRQV